MQKIELVLKNEKRRLYDRFAIFLFVLNAIAICIFLTRANYQELSQNPFPGLAGLAISLIMVGILIFDRSARRMKYSFFIASACIVLYWLYLDYWWIALIMLLLLGLYAVSKRELKIILKDDTITYPSFPKKIFDWRQLNNVMLKDDLLTIDSKDNKIIQQLIDEEKTKVNEAEFNEFCRSQLTRNDRGNNKTDKSGAVEGLAEGISIIAGS